MCMHVPFSSPLYHLSHTPPPSHTSSLTNTSPHTHFLPHNFHLFPSHTSHTPALTHLLPHKHLPSHTLPPSQPPPLPLTHITHTPPSLTHTSSLITSTSSLSLNCDEHTYATFTTHTRHNHFPVSPSCKTSSYGCPVRLLTPSKISPWRWRGGRSGQLLITLS